MKTWFAFQTNVVISKHRSKEAAEQAILKLYKKFKKYPLDSYHVRQLKSPGYWERGDNPAKHYYIDVQAA